MTHEERSQDAVMRLQEMLEFLSQRWGWLPGPERDGTYGESTLESVMRLQRELGLPVDGKVDRRTWNAIRGMWNLERDRRGRGRPVRLVPGMSVQVGRGEETPFFALQQVMFELLSAHLEQIRRSESDGVNGEESQENLRWLQKAAGLEPTGEMDHATWEMLARLYEVMVVGETGFLPRFSTGGWG